MLDYPKIQFNFLIEKSMYKAVAMQPFGEKLGIVSLASTAFFGRKCRVNESASLTIQDVGDIEITPEVYDLEIVSKMHGDFHSSLPIHYVVRLYLPLSVDNWYMTEGKYKPTLEEYKNIYALYYPELETKTFIKNWFSNFNKMTVPLVIEGTEFYTIENYYQAMKTEDLDFRKIIASISPSEAKKLGKGLKLRPDWDNIKDQIMYAGLWHKYTKDLKHSETLVHSNTPIVEFNNWQDNYWGVSVFNFTGQNKLGRMLMNIRYRLSMEIPF